jgi:hypothetical protein
VPFEGYRDSKVPLLCCCSSFRSKPSECIALDRESTHPLENFVGRVRKDSNDVNAPERMKAVIADTEIVTEALIRLESDQNVHGRANLAGIQLTNEPPTKKVYEIELATPIAPQAVALICLKAAHVCEGGLSPEEQILFLQFRGYFTLLQKAAEESWTSSEIDQRFIVGSGSRIVT